MIQPGSDLTMIRVEGSEGEEKGGEYVMDITEYYSGDIELVKFYQLKHTSIPGNKPFTLSLLKKTIVGFAARFRELESKNKLAGVTFTIVTNRSISASFQEGIRNLKEGKTSGSSFLKTMKKYTELDGVLLQQFCNLLILEDSEGDYQVQEQQLRIEMARLQPGTIDTAQVHSIVSLVQERVLPKSDHRIYKENILGVFGVESERQMFPAPPSFEALTSITVRSQYDELLEKIMTSVAPIIISASGGVGKSVFSQYVINNLPENSVGIAYDCFGSGRYRSRSEPRHRHRDALVQVVNELAVLGLCECILVGDTTSESDIMRRFLAQLDFAVKKLRIMSASAKLVLIVDAADNAEMAAAEFGDSCFVKELLLEEFPEGCSIVLLCRPERLDLLKAPQTIEVLSLTPFTEEETLATLQKYFPSVGATAASEFHKLTSGNPRVQMNAITVGHSSVEELLSYLGPNTTTVDQQIEQQLSKAIDNVKEFLPYSFQNEVDKICTGLASLPPNIPIDVLAKTSGVEADVVKSFISDIGRPLWHSETTVLFRDEPTETWFRKKYTGAQASFVQYARILESLAEESTYVSQALSQIYLQAGQFDKLVSTALSTDLLPLKNPIDARSVLIYRLQFAFKAALKLKRYADATQLGLRVGEELAGNDRQLALFKDNVDLIAYLQDAEKVKEIAIKGQIKSVWEGSKNVYSASLLSNIEDYRGETSGYLRTATNWLRIAFDEAKKKDRRDRESSVSIEDAAELAFVHLNLNGVRKCLQFINGLAPKTVIFQMMRLLTSRLVDAGRFEEINDFLKYGRRNKYHVVAISGELSNMGVIPYLNSLTYCLDALNDAKRRIPKPEYSYRENITPSIVSFLEMCLHHALDVNKILSVLDYYIPLGVQESIASHYDRDRRDLVMKALAIRSVISGGLTVDDIVSSSFKVSEKVSDYSNKKREFSEVVGSLLPHYMLRIKVLCNLVTDILSQNTEANTGSEKALRGRYREHDFIDNEVAIVKVSSFIWHTVMSDIFDETVYTNLVQTDQFAISQRIGLIRIGSRVSNLARLQADFENSTYEIVKGLHESGPEEVSGYFTELARAIMFSDRDNAAVYFNEAVEIAGKFGDEIVQRWQALVALGDRVNMNASDELAYRFIRCGELVGKFVYREKYWNRSGVLITGAKMSPAVSIAALSRWRDRGVGRFEYEFAELVAYLVKSGNITSRIGWSLTRLLEHHDSKSFLDNCLDRADSEETTALILNNAYELNAKEGSTISFWKHLRDKMKKSNLSTQEIDLLLSKSNNLNVLSSLGNQATSDAEVEESSQNKASNFLKGLNLESPTDISLAIKRYLKEGEEVDTHWSLDSLWEEMIIKVGVKGVNTFILSVLNSGEINIYDCLELINMIPAPWKDRLSYRKSWPSFVHRFGYRYADDLTRFGIDMVVKRLDLSEETIVELGKGVVEGISDSSNTPSAQNIFGFVPFATNFINDTEAVRLTEYAIGRFEIHMPEDFGDGMWSNWLQVSQDLNESIAGFIWSALGSPYSHTRWQACHVVIDLVAFGCKPVLDFLMNWWLKGEVMSFGGKRFPFYNLHAKQYLLIALYRVSVEHSIELVEHRDLFLRCAKDVDHVVIQHLARNIGLSIENKVGNVYSADEIEILKQIGVGTRDDSVDRSDTPIDSYLHEAGKVDTSLGFRSAYDFNRYWYEPLGSVFGVSSKQIEELCGEVIAHEWKLPLDGKYNSDPRIDLWRNDRAMVTHSHHGGYPKVDNWSFYKSYHSMMTVASRLVKNMPILKSRWSPNDDSFKEWLESHVLTRSDGRLLSDYRSKLPVDRPQWISNETSKDWRTDISDNSFLNCLRNKIGEEIWLTIRGGWSERHDKLEESLYITAALVSKDKSDALLRALSTCSDPRDYKIPDFEDNLEIDHGDFWLKGFVSREDRFVGLDESDPYGKDVPYPPLTLGAPFMTHLNLRSDSKGSDWHDVKGKVVMESRSWKSDTVVDEEVPAQAGQRLNVSLSVLKQLCCDFNCDIVIAVEINRDIRYDYRPDKNAYEYKSHNRIYLLSQDGKLRNGTASIDLGETDCSRVKT